MRRRGPKYSCAPPRRARPAREERGVDGLHGLDMYSSGFGTRDDDDDVGSKSFFELTDIKPERTHQDTPTNRKMPGRHIIRLALPHA